MDAYHLSPTDGSLADLVGRVEAGESVEIERDGRVVARIVPVMIPSAEQKTPFDWEAYWELIKDMPCYPGNSVVDMRKEARY